MVVFAAAAATPAAGSTRTDDRAELVIMRSARQALGKGQTRRSARLPTPQDVRGGGGPGVLGCKGPRCCPSHSLLPLPPVVGSKLYTSPGRGSAYLHTPGVMQDLG